MSDHAAKTDRTRRRTLVLLAVATAVGSTLLAGVIVAFGGLTTLSLVGAATAVAATMLAPKFARR